MSPPPSFSATASSSFIFFPGSSRGGVKPTILDGGYCGGVICETSTLRGPFPDLTPVIKQPQQSNTTRRNMQEIYNYETITSGARSIKYFLQEIPAASAKNIHINLRLGRSRRRFLMEFSFYSKQEEQWPARQVCVSYLRGLSSSYAPKGSAVIWIRPAWFLSSP
ncbi:hypothetical protein Hdeb2414_s0011g00365791 [Helianthus debilis subsp. tardiflorus]